jgi:thioredoxin-related protein
MEIKMKKWLAGIFFLASIAFTQDVKWLSFQDGYQKVLKEKKPAVIDFYADWCTWCKVMDKKTFANLKVAKQLKTNFICIRINPDSTNQKINYNGKTFTNLTFGQALGMQGLPLIVFMDKSGQFITSRPGYVEADAFLPLLEYIKKECYNQKISLQDYLDKKEKCP